jgi:hypothetical protein
MFTYNEHHNLGLKIMQGKEMLFVTDVLNIVPFTAVANSALSEYTQKI